MKSNPFKAFQVFTLDTGHKQVTKAADVRRAEATAEKLEGVLSEDPKGSAWETIGLVPPDGVSLMLPTGQGVLLALQFNARILPGKVRDEHLKAKVIALMEQTGQKVSKRDYAQLRDETEAELLPKSHIRRSIVPVLITKFNKAIIFTSSAKKADDVMSVLIDVFDLLGAQITFQRLAVVDSVTAWLGDEALGGATDCPVAPTTNIVIKANEEGGATVRVKDRDIDSGEVQSMLEGVSDGNKRVVEMGMVVLESPHMRGLDGITFTITEKLVFKGIKFPDLVLRAAVGQVKDEGDVGEFHAVAELAAQTAVGLVDMAVAYLGGEFGEDDL